MYCRGGESRRLKRLISLPCQMRAPVAAQALSPGQASLKLNKSWSFWHWTVGHRSGLTLPFELSSTSGAWTAARMHLTVCSMALMEMLTASSTVTGDAPRSFERRPIKVSCMQGGCGHAWQQPDNYCQTFMPEISVFLHSDWPKYSKSSVQWVYSSSTFNVMMLGIRLLSSWEPSKMCFLCRKSLRYQPSSRLQAIDDSIS